MVEIWLSYSHRNTCGSFGQLIIVGVVIWSSGESTCALFPRIVMRMSDYCTAPSVQLILGECEGGPSFSQ